MRYGLGTLRVDGDREAESLMLAMFDELQNPGGSAGAPAGGSRPAPRIERVRDLQAAMTLLRAPRTEARDLLEALPRGEVDRGWLQALHDTLVQAATGGNALALTCCEHERGPDGDTLSLAVVLQRRRASVRAGDVVRAGFAATSHRAGEVAIAPRLYRVRCTNGIITALGDGEDQRCTAETVADAARACLSGAVFEGEVERLRQAAGTELADPERLLRLARAHSQWSEVREAFDREGDFSGWGLINAVTAVARFSRTWAERLQRESDVAGILALLERPDPQRLRALALELPREPELESEAVSVHAGAGAFASR